jgi:hypothetical protein
MLMTHAGRESYNSETLLLKQQITHPIMRQPPSQHQQLLQVATFAAMIMLFDLENNDSELEEFYSYCLSKTQKQYLNAKGTTTQFHPCYDLSIMQGLSESCFLQLF